jgi:hypothetical protein
MTTEQTPPYIGFSNDDLGLRPSIKSGDMIACPNCGEKHGVEAGKDDKGNDTDLLLFYRCGDGLYLAGLSGRNVIRTK